MTCANCGYQTIKAPDGSDYYCYVCAQSAVQIIAMLPDGTTTPEIAPTANVLTLDPGLVALFLNGHAVLQWYDGEYYQAIKLNIQGAKNVHSDT